MKILRRKYTYTCNRKGTRHTTVGGASVKCEGCGAQLFYLEENGRKLFGMHGRTKEQVEHQCHTAEIVDEP